MTIEQFRFNEWNELKSTILKCLFDAEFIELELIEPGTLTEIIQIKNAIFCKVVSQERFWGRFPITYFHKP